MNRSDLAFVDTAISSESHPSRPVLGSGGYYYSSGTYGEKVYGGPDAYAATPVSTPRPETSPRRRSASQKIAEAEPTQQVVVPPPNIEADDDASTKKQLTKAQADPTPATDPLESQEHTDPTPAKNWG